MASCITITGHSFRARDGHILMAYARALRLTRPDSPSCIDPHPCTTEETCVWVPLPLMSLLQLHLRNSNICPIRLVSDNDACLYYHVSQMAQSKEEVHARWRNYCTRFPHMSSALCGIHGGSNNDTTTANTKNATTEWLCDGKESTSSTGDVGITAAQNTPEQFPSSMSALAIDTSIPLNANGERFATSVEHEMLARSSTAARSASGLKQVCRSGGMLAMNANQLLTSRYWVTVDEAQFLFDAPFSDEYVRNVHQNGVFVAHDLCNRAVPYYNAAATTHPLRFDAYTCRRYDPINCHGHFYAPHCAIRLKQWAIRYRCLMSTRWMTPARILRYGARIRAGVVPVCFCIGDDSIVELVNIAMTSDPERLESIACSVFTHARRPLCTAKTCAHSSSPTTDVRTCARDDEPLLLGARV